MSAIAKSKRRFPIGRKMYLFVIVTVLLVALGTAAISYFLSVDQIDGYFKRLAMNSADNFAEYIDPEFFKELRAMAESEEYQAVRDVAEETEDDSLIENYLREKGLWERYEKTQDQLCTYLANMDDIKYLYIVAYGDKDALYDMYLMDDRDNPLTQTGYIEEREEELRGIDPNGRIEPSISHGDWGWLCSAFEPVYDKDGNIVCHVGCDVDMERIMTERRNFLIYIGISSFIFMGVVLALAIIFANKAVVKPLKALTEETKKFSPAEGESYEDAHVVALSLSGNDEITDIYEVIRSMEINIVDYLGDLKKAENDIRSKDSQIDEMSKEAYRDNLTSVGNKAAYMKKSEELSLLISEGIADFAIVVADLNDLKKINDKYGHRAGDSYIKGCCHVICDNYKHSPVFRIGGDEFVAVLQAEDFEHRQKLLVQLKEKFAASYSDTKAAPEERYSAAVGMAEYASDDFSVEFVFKRADKRMYEDKMRFKEQNGSYR